jgi:hypothetical protein
VAWWVKEKPLGRGLRFGSAFGAALWLSALCRAQVENDHYLHALAIHRGLMFSNRGFAVPKADSFRKRSDCRRQASALDSPSGSLGATNATLETIIKDEARRNDDLNATSVQRRCSKVGV